MADDRTFDAKRDDLIRAILADGSLSGLAVRVGVFISLHVHRERGYAWPNLDTIAAGTGSEKRSVIRSIKQLDGRHFIKLSGGGRAFANEYQPIWPASETVTARSPFTLDTIGTKGDHTAQKGDRTAQKTVTARSPHTLNINPDKTPEGQNRNFSGNNGELNSSPPSPSSHGGAMARQEKDKQSVAPVPAPVPDHIDAAAMCAARMAIKHAEADLDAEALGKQFLAARKRGNARGEIAGGFARYVDRAIIRHCQENREARRVATLASLKAAAAKEAAR